MIVLTKTPYNGFRITLENIDENDIYELYNKNDIIKFWKHKPGINLNMFVINDLWILTSKPTWDSENVKPENYISLSILNDCNDIEFLKNHIIEHIENVLENYV